MTEKVDTLIDVFLLRVFILSKKLCLVDFLYMKSFFLICAMKKKTVTYTEIKKVEYFDSDYQA